jgi:hypothetical protein
MLVLMYLTVFTLTPFQRARRSCRGETTSIHLQIAPRLRMSRTITLLPMWLCQEPLHRFTVLHVMLLGLRSQEHEVGWTCNNGEGVVPNTQEFY